MPRAPALHVPRDRAEETRRVLLAQGRLRTDLRPRRGEDVVVFPVTDGGPEEDFEAAAGPPRDWRALASVPMELAPLLPSSFDVIGHVLVLKLPEGLEPHARTIADALIATHPNVRTVALDRGVAGELRVRRLDVVAGEPSTLTTHVEHGMRLRIDPATAYFSPRLATERLRVAEQVRAGERVVDLFAGVGPFAILLARKARPARVDAVDLNPAAHALLVENVRANKVEGVVRPHLADAREWAAAHPGCADRVVLNLPHDAWRFLDAAIALVGPAGGVLHHHAIANEAGLERQLAHARSEAARLGRSVREVARREVRTYSPEERHWAVDLEVPPDPSKPS